MNNSDKQQKNVPTKSNKFKLKNFMTLPEAAQELSKQLDEEIAKSDVLQFALEGKLKLSVKLAHPVSARLVKHVPSDEVLSHVCYGISIRYDGNVISGRKGPVKAIIYLSDEVVILNGGVWDLPLICEEKYEVERELSGQMTDHNTINQELFFGSFLVKNPEGGEMYELQKLIGPTPYETPQGKGMTEESYIPAECLPDDRQFVIRTTSLNDFIGNLTSEELYEKAEPQSAQSSRVSLDIGADDSRLNEKKLIGKSAIAKYMSKYMGGTCSVSSIKKWMKEQPPPPL